MIGKCYLYALETFFDLHASLSSGVVAVGQAFSVFDAGLAPLPQAQVAELGQFPLLVHGFVLGDSGELKDKRFGHAWLEGNEYVVDCGSREKEHLLERRDVYYKFWRINPEECRRYTLQQAVQHIVATGWDSGWSDLPANTCDGSYRLPQVEQALLDSRKTAVACR
jgi:hypothetical protein